MSVRDLARAPWVAPVGLLLVCALLVGELWLPGRTIARGDLLIYFPTLHQAPWQGAWNPWISLGTPALANPQTGAFYPPAWLLALDWFAFLPLYLWLHYGAAALGTWAWLRRASSSRLAPWLGGAFYACCGPAWSLATKVDKLPGYALLPLMLLGLDLLLRERASARRRLGWWILAGGLALCWLGGSVEGLATAAVALPLWALLLPGTSMAPTAAAKRVGWIAAAGVLGVALSACSLLPLFLLLPETTRSGGLDSTAALDMSTRAVDWLRCLAWHPALLDGIAAVSSRQHWLESLYAGLVALPLLALGLAASGPARSRLAAVVGIGVFVAIALGDQNPLAALAWDRLPLLGTIRYPEKFWLGTLPFQAWLLARGWSWLAARGGLQGRWWPGAAITVLLCADLVVAGWRVFPVELVQETFAPSPAILAIQRDQDDGRPAMIWDESLHDRGGALPAMGGAPLHRVVHHVAYPNTAVLHGIAYAYGSNALRLAAHHRLIARAVSGTPAERRALMRFLGATHWLVWDQHRALELATELGLAPVPAAPGAPLDIGLLAEPEPSPAVDWVDAARGWEDLDAVLGVMARGSMEDGLRLALDDPHAARLVALTDEDVAFDARPAESEMLAPGLWRATVDAPDHGALRLRQAWAPGWEASVDGGPFETAGRSDGCLVASPVPAGSHEVIFRYRPAGLLPGLLISALALLGTALVARRL